MIYCATLQNTNGCWGNKRIEHCCPTLFYYAGNRVNAITAKHQLIEEAKMISCVVIFIFGVLRDLSKLHLRAR